MPQFFQIIKQDGEAIRQSKLWIPRKFLTVHGHDISKYVQVKDPNGKKWDLEWSRYDGEIWFKKRWEEFADYYSLRHGHLLVFKYEGNSQFSIVIFDNTASEIEYPVATTDEVGSHQYGEVEDVRKETDNREDSQDQYFYNSSPSLPRKRKNSPEKCSSRSPKKMKTSAKGSEGVSTIQKNRAVIRERKSEVIQKIVDFTSQYPHFSKLMRPSHVRPKYDKLYLPIPICKKYLESAVGHRPQVLLYSNGNCWKMNLTLEEQFYRAKLYHGWGKFSEDNNLRAGDVCVFELISQDDIKFNVHIFPWNEKKGDCSSSGKQEQVSKRKKAESKTKTRLTQPNIPCFEVVMSSSFVNKGYMRIPADFARDHDIKEGVKNISVLAGGRSWKATYVKPNWIYACSFIRYNGLQVGDLCIFQLIGDRFFKVDIEKLNVQV